MEDNPKSNQFLIQEEIVSVEEENVNGQVENNKEKENINNEEDQDQSSEQVLTAGDNAALSPNMSVPDGCMDIVLQKIDHIQQLIEKRITYDEGKENLIRCLAEDMKIYRDDWLKQQKRPIILDMVMFYDSMEIAIKNLEEQDELTVEWFHGLLSALQDELLEVLARQDVYPFDEHPPFLDRRLHRTISLESTEYPEENNAVSRIVCTGFTWGDRVLRPENVVIKKYNPAD